MTDRFWEVVVCRSINLWQRSSGAALFGPSRLITSKYWIIFFIYFKEINVLNFFCLVWSRRRKKVSEFSLRLSFQCESRELGLGSGNESCVSAKLTTTQQVVGKEARQLLFSQQKDEEEGPGTTRQFPHPIYNTHKKNKYKKKKKREFF